MSIITHGGEMSLAPTVRSVIAKTGQSLRQVLHRLANYQFDAIQLDATLSGLRPRDLDHRARQDVLALLNRSNLRLSGMDLFIPRDHYLATEHLDRAMQATLASIELAADFGRIPLSIALPIQQMADDTKTALIESAEGHSVRLAVHAEDQLDELIAWVEQVDLPTVGLKTLKKCKSAGLKGIVLKNKRNVFLEKNKSISFANKNKMFITVK